MDESLKRVEDDLRDHEKDNKKTFARIGDKMDATNSAVATTNEMLSALMATIKEMSDDVKEITQTQKKIIAQVAEVRTKFDIKMDDIGKHDLSLIEADAQQAKAQAESNEKEIEKIKLTPGKVAIAALTWLVTTIGAALTGFFIKGGGQ